MIVLLIHLDWDTSPVINPSRIICLHDNLLRSKIFKMHGGRILFHKI
jgi:hypothetical protein